MNKEEKQIEFLKVEIDSLKLNLDMRKTRIFSYLAIAMAILLSLIVSYKDFLFPLYILVFAVFAILLFIIHKDIEKIKIDREKIKKSYEELMRILRQ